MKNLCKYSMHMSLQPNNFKISWPGTAEYCSLSGTRIIVKYPAITHKLHCIVFFCFISTSEAAQEAPEIYFPYYIILCLVSIHTRYEPILQPNPSILHGKCIRENITRGGTPFGAKKKVPFYIESSKKSISLGNGERNHFEFSDKKCCEPYKNCPGQSRFYILSLSSLFLWWRASGKYSMHREEARTCEAWFQLTFGPQKWNLKAHMWYQLSPFPSSNAAIAMQHHPGNIHKSVATPRYSATPWYVLIQLPSVIDTISKR